MKTCIVAMVLFAGAVVAVAATNDPPVIPPGTEHMDTATFWKLAISGITPLLVGFARKLVPNIPKVLLPLSTPFLGIGLGLLMNWLNVANLGWVDLGQAGAAAVMVRETWKNALQYRPPSPRATTD